MTKTLRKISALLVVVSFLLFAAVACNDDVKSLCRNYQTGSNFALTIAIPALEILMGDPEYVRYRPAYEEARDGLLDCDPLIREMCRKASNGEDVDILLLSRLVARATAAAIQIILILRDIDGETPEMLQAVEKLRKVYAGTRTDAR